MFGEEAELRFMLKAFEQGIRVTKPFGDSMPYDFIADGGCGLRRVQVKSSWYRARGRYSVQCVRGTSRRRYDRDQIDILAAFVEPFGAWYIIPVKALTGSNSLTFSPDLPTHKGRWEKYREAWHLLRPPAPMTVPSV